MFGNVDYLAQSLNHASLMADLSIKKVASTGDPVRLGAMEQGAGGSSFASGLINRTNSKSNTISSFQNAISYMQSQDAGLSQAESIYDRMYAIASLSADPMTDNDTRRLLNEEFKQLIESAKALSATEFNGVKLFDSRASTQEYSVSFTSGLTNETLHTEHVDTNNNGVYNNGELRIWEVTNDVLHNSGKLRLKVNSGVVGDRYILKQGEHIIFDTGYWATNGNAKQFDYDEFEVEWGPDRNTSFKFYANPNGNSSEVDLDGPNGIKGDGDDGVIPIDSNYDNKSFVHRGNTNGYLNQLGLTDDGLGNTGMDAKIGFSFESNSNTRQVKVYDSRDDTTFLTLRIESKTLFQIDSDPFSLPELIPTSVGGKKDLQVDLHHVGLGLLRIDDESAGYPEISIENRENAIAAMDVLRTDIDGLTAQKGKLTSNYNRVEHSLESTQQELVTHQKVISQLSGQHFAEELGNLNEMRTRRSSSSSLMSRIIKLNRELASTLL
jgi:flagellin-like hook-associated protein FlgL